MLKLSLNLKSSKVHTSRLFNSKLINLLFVLLFSLPFFTSFMAGLSLKAFGSTIYSTAFIYFSLLVLLVMLYIRNHDNLNFYYFKIFFFIIFVFLLSFFLFPNTRIFYFNLYIEIFVYIIIFLPFSIILPFNSNAFEDYKFPLVYVFITPFLTLIGIHLLDFESFIHYMHISNMILPSMLITYYFFRVKPNLIFFLFLIFYLYLQVIYGSRMALGSFSIFVMLLEFIKFRYLKRSIEKNILLLVYGLIFSFFVFALINYIHIVDFLVRNFNLSGRTIDLILSGDFASISSRSVIYTIAIDTILNLGFNLHGLFGDRLILQLNNINQPYIHNLVFEILISFGLILGTLIIVIFVSLILKTLLNKNNFNLSLILIFMISLTIPRLMVSGSFIIEGNFLLLIGVMFMLLKYKKRIY
jgi:hypothetical protein